MNYLYHIFPFLLPFNSTDVKMNKTMAMQKLHDYGYLNDMNANETEMKESLKEFQYYANIQPTGEMTKETIEIMNKPRCGHPDNMINEKRRKRYTFGSNGPSEESALTYRTKKYPYVLTSKEVDEIFSQALNLWSEYSELNFTQFFHISDFEIVFEPIDGMGNMYGFASGPTLRTIILDIDEYWTKSGNDGINLLQIATHEFGHALGLGHSDRSNSVMYPYYLEYKQSFSLDIDDIIGIRALYRTSLKQFKTNQGDTSILCRDPKIDTIFTAPDEYVYVLKNEYYWKFTLDFIVVEGPKLINSRWSELPTKIDAAFTAWNNVTYFFKEEVVWKYTLNEKTKKSKLIRYAFDNIPDDLDAAFIWNANGRLYFFKGSKYWMLDPFKPPSLRVRDYFPLPIKLWNGIPNNIDGVVSINQFTYFFKGDVYYKYINRYRKVEDGYPKSIKNDIFKCLV
ncbi:hypothetical protein FQR65_LT02622 [Abscondita terminalis]|nr:hypothetical protein FQR65_LT02622 [Abscondita terminalis]